MKYLNALNKIDGLGHKKMKLLVNFFESGEKIWHASFAQLEATGIGASLSQKIIEEREKIDVEAAWQKLQTENIQIFTIENPQYPKLLKQIPDSPYLIYMKGDLSCLDLPLVAIVGSRKLTAYGSQAARSFARDLATRGVCVVSGLAFGVDACSHLGALEVRGKTIAVLGNSLDAQSIAPRSNFQLSEDILAGGGLLLSEYPPPTHSEIWTFPARNRIMAGMCLGTLVIEAAEKSGSLITANLALDYNREVFAMPGPIFSPQSIGTHKLIKAGAKIACNAADILEELRLDAASPQKEKTSTIVLNSQEEIACKVLSHESLHIDTIARMTKLDTSSLGGILTMLEIKGVVKNIGGQNYIRL